MRIKKVSTAPIPSVDGAVVDSLSGSSTTNAPSVRAVNEGLANSKLVKEVELTTASNNITIDGLNLANDGGLYEVHFQVPSSPSSAGVFMKVNGANSNQSIYQEFSTSVTYTTAANRIGRLENNRYGYFMVNISLCEYIVAISHGFDGSFAYTGHLRFTQNNLTTLQFTKEAGTFAVGTKIRIYKK